MSDHGHDHGHHRPRPASEIELRARALEALLVDKGLVSTDAIDAVVELYENDVGPQNGSWAHFSTDRPSFWFNTVVTVAGNHDLIALGQLSEDRCIPLARNSLRWTRDVLREDARRYLAALPLRVQIGRETVMAHGSLDDPQEYVSQPSQAAAQLDQLAAEFPGARLLVLGHTHRPRAHAANGMLLDLRTPTSLAENGLILINPGSVGQSRERAALARFALLDLDAGQAKFMSAAYDTAACRTALRKLGLPAGSCHLAPSLMASCVGRARRMGERIARLAKWGLGGATAPRAPVGHEKGASRRPPRPRSSCCPNCQKLLSR